MSDWTEEELAALRRAYATGTRSVTYDGHSVTYDNGDDLKRRIEYIERQIAIAATPASRPLTGRARFSRGL